MEQKIKQDIPVDANIRRVRKQQGIGQTELIRRVNLLGEPLTREALVKIERGIQHIKTSQLKAIKEALDTTYDELMK